MKKPLINTKKLHKAVAQSSKMEGLSFLAAKKNKKAIKTLKIYDRAYAISNKR